MTFSIKCTTNTLTYATQVICFLLLKCLLNQSTLETLELRPYLLVKILFSLWIGRVVYHVNGSVISFTDGHAEFRRWLEEDTKVIPQSVQNPTTRKDIVVSPNNRDLKWLQDKAVVPDPNDHNWYGFMGGIGRGTIGILERWTGRLAKLKFTLLGDGIGMMSGNEPKLHIARASINNNCYSSTLCSLSIQNYANAKDKLR